MTRWPSSAWLELITSVLIAAVEAAILAPWLHVLAGIAGHPDATIPSPVGIAVVGLASYWSARWFIDGGWDIAAARGMSLLVWLALVLVWFGIASGAGLATPVRFVGGVFRPDGALWAILIVAGLAWWRGVRLGAEPGSLSAGLTQDLILRALVFIAGAVVVGVVAGDRFGRHVLDSTAVALPVAIIGSLVAAAAVQVRTAQTRTRAGGKRAGLGWVGAATGLAVAIVLVALVVAGIAGPDVWRQVLQPVTVLLGWIGDALSWLILGFAYVVFLVLTPLFWLARWLIGEQQPPEQPQQDTGPPPSFPEFQEQAQGLLAPWMVHVLQFAGIAALIALGVWFVLRRLQHYRAGARDRADEEVRESVWSRELAMEQLRGWLRGLGPRPGAGRVEIDLSVPPRTVRDAYRRMLVLAARRGAPREAAESPIDYADRLGATWTSAAAPVDDLTRRYLLARYGEQDGEPNATLAREDWEAIRARLQAEDKGRSP